MTVCNARAVAAVVTATSIFSLGVGIVLGITASPWDSASGCRKELLDITKVVVAIARVITDFVQCVAGV